MFLRPNRTCSGNCSFSGKNGRRKLIVNFPKGCKSSNNIEDIARDLLPKAWMEVLMYDPTVNKQTKEKTIKYANVNFWRGIAKERRYNYHHNKLYRLMVGSLLDRWDLKSIICNRAVYILTFCKKT